MTCVRHLAFVAGFCHICLAEDRLRVKRLPPLLRPALRPSARPAPLTDAGGLELEGRVCWAPHAHGSHGSCWSDPLSSPCWPRWSLSREGEPCRVQTRPVLLLLLWVFAADTWRLCNAMHMKLTTAAPYGPTMMTLPVRLRGALPGDGCEVTAAPPPPFRSALQASPLPSSRSHLSPVF